IDKEYYYYEETDTTSTNCRPTFYFLVDESEQEYEKLDITYSLDFNENLETTVLLGGTRNEYLLKTVYGSVDKTNTIVDFSGFDNSGANYSPDMGGYGTEMTFQTTPGESSLNGDYTGTYTQTFKIYKIKLDDVVYYDGSIVEVPPLLSASNIDTQKFAGNVKESLGGNSEGLLSLGALIIGTFFAFYILYKIQKILNLDKKENKKGRKKIADLPDKELTPNKKKLNKLKNKKEIPEKEYIWALETFKPVRQIGSAFLMGGNSEYRRKGKLAYEFYYKKNGKYFYGGVKTEKQFVSLMRKKSKKEKKEDEKKGSKFFARGFWLSKTSNKGSYNIERPEF
ncbi:MAG: hypothetical protein ACOC2U_01160, partial [bacterium]